MKLLRIGSRGSEVKALQSSLNKRLKAYDTQLKVDGIYGPRTAAAVRQFQSLANIGIDGIFGPETRNALDGPISKKTSKRPSVATGTKSKKWMKVAYEEVDQKEIEGAKHNPRIIKYHSTTTLKATTDETPWCASFVNWVLKSAGIEGTNSAAAASWLDWGKTSEAREGAIVVIKRKDDGDAATSGNHVGFLVNETGKHYIILGGNQSNRVKESRFLKTAWKLRGYRWPKDQ